MRIGIREPESSRPIVSSLKNLAFWQASPTIVSPCRQSESFPIELTIVSSSRRIRLFADNSTPIISVIVSGQYFRPSESENRNRFRFEIMDSRSNSRASSRNEHQSEHQSEHQNECQNVAAAIYEVRSPSTITSHSFPKSIALSFTCWARNRLMAAAAAS